MIELRQITKDFEELLHIFKHIRKFEVEEAKIRTKKRRLFQRACDVIDRMALDNEKKRKNDDVVVNERN